MKRANSLVYCEKCKANRSMKQLGDNYKCNYCGTEHLKHDEGQIHAKPEEVKTMTATRIK